MAANRSNRGTARELARLKQVEQELNARLKQQAAVAELGQRALKIKDLRSLMGEAVRLAAETLEVDLCHILELRPDGRWLLLRAGVGWGAGEVEAVTIEVTEGTQASFTLSTGKPVIVPDLAAEERFSISKWQAERGAVSSVSVVIPGEHGPYGILGALSREQRLFKKEDAHFLQGVANLLAAAILRLQKESALRLSRDELEIILQGVADGITVQDPSGRLMYANQAAARISGYPGEDEMLKTPIQQITARFELLDEAGHPFPIEQLPGRLALKGIQKASAVIRFREKTSGEERWSLVRSQPVFDEASRVVMAVNIFHEISDLKRAEINQRILAEAGNLLSTSLDYEKTLSEVARLAVPHLADWCIVDLLEEGRSIRRIAVAHSDPEKLMLAQDLQERYPPNFDAPTGVGRVLRSGQPEFYPEISDELLETTLQDPQQVQRIKELQLRSVLISPLIARGRTLGALTLVWAESGRRYTDSDVALAEELSRRAALAIDNARLYRESLELNAELETRVAKRTAQLQSIIAKMRNEIAERKKAEEARQKSETLLQSLFDSAPDALILVNEEGIIEEVNPQAEGMFGYRREEMIGREIDYLLPSRYHARHQGFRAAYFSDPRTRPMGVGLELLGRRKDGGEFPIDIMLSPVNVEGKKLVISAIRDISERVQMEADLAEVQKRLIESGEAERIHLAQELHDGPIQELYGVAYQLRNLESMAGFEESLASPSETIQHVIEQLRSICGELRPPALAPFGLEKAILAHLESIQEAHPELKVEHDLMEDRQELPERLRLALFRIYQHAVSNVIRHAQADTLRVSFSFNSDHAVLEIQDNGCGFELPSRWVELARKGHLGLAGTVERAEAIGGQLKIISSPGKGTLVRVTVPRSPEMQSPYSTRLSNLRISY